MSDDDVRRAAVLRGTETNGGTGRRRVLGGVAAAVGAALGFAGAAAGETTASDDVGTDIPTCDDGCTLKSYCCEENSSGCVEYCWYCYC